MTDENRSALALISTKGGFSDTEQRIVDYLLAHLDEGPTMTSARLADRSKTSEATVSRLCKRLGFSNYRSFQFSLARDIAVRSGDQEVTREISLDDMEQSLVNIAHAKQREIEATIRSLDHQVLREVVGRIANAGLIQLVAAGSSNAVAMDAAIKFGQLGLRCSESRVIEASTAVALTLTPDDVLLVISNSGKSQRLDRVVRAARRSDACVVLITGDPSSPLAREADYVLQTVNYEALLTTGDFTFSKISATLIVEVIYNFLLPLIPDARTRISTYEEFIQPDKEME